METNKYNIAMFFCGRVKSYEESKKWLLEFIKNNSVDTFCSINGDLDDYHKQFLTDFNIKKSSFENYVLPDSHNFTEQLLLGTNIYKTCSMFYNMMKCMDMILKEEKKYDIIIYMRADVNSNDILKLEYDLTNTIYIPNGFDYFGVNDQMAYGNPNVMDQYCSIYNCLPDYCSNHNVRFNPEIILKHHINKLNINIKRYQFRYSLNYSRKIHKDYNAS